MSNLKLDCEQSLFLFGIVEGSAICDCKTASGEAASHEERGCKPEEIKYFYFPQACALVPRKPEESKNT